MKYLYTLLVPLFVALFVSAPEIYAQKPTFTAVATTGFAASTDVMRRDPSDVIRVGDLYYVWYTKGDRFDGYDSTVWYATSTNGFHWQEQGECVPRGAEGEFDEQSAFTPNILVASDRYWLFYTGVPKPFDNVGNQVTFSAIGAAVADSPDGPWTKLENNPLLVVSTDTNDFDSMRVDCAVLMVRDGAYWLYYKGRQWNNTPGNTKLGVAIAQSPEGPYVKYAGNPVFPAGHEMMVWPVGSGVMALITSGGSGMLYAPDGFNFARVMSLTGLPFAAGFYRPEAFTDSGLGEPPAWGMQIVSSGGNLPTIGRFNCEWHGLGALPEPGLIQWDTPFFATGNETVDVRTNGVLVQAVNFGPSSITPLTLNAVAFPTGSVNAVMGGAFQGALTNSASLTPAYSNLLNSLAFGGGRTNSFLLGDEALNPGQYYLLQVWFADNRQVAGRNNIGMRLSGQETTNFVTLRSGFEGGAYGQYAVGIFAATGTSQRLYLRTSDDLGSPQMGNLHLNAFQLRRFDDYDEDGLDDAWELYYTASITTNGVGDLTLLSGDPGADFDGDGVSDLDEFRAGTNPVDPDSFFRLVSIQHHEDGNWQVQWPGVPSNGAGHPIHYEVISVSLTSAPPFEVLAVHTSAVPELISLSVTNEATFGTFGVRIVEP